jgi:predicted anti-sigma-YlaC factor YlaD
MNCLECQERLQERLDGLPTADQEAVDRHLAACVPCRERHAAAARLEEGLRLTVPAAAPGLAARVAAAVLADRRRLRTRRFMGAVVGAAAAVLLIVVAGDQLRRVLVPAPRPEPVAPVAVPEPGPDNLPAVAVGSLRDSVAEAGSVVVTFGRRTADEAVGLLRDFVPPAPEVAMPPSPIDPPMRSLETAGQAISAGLEPVTSSARRAFGLLLRDMPPVDQPEDKPGL